MLEQILIAFVCIFAVIGLITSVYTVIDLFMPKPSYGEEIELVMFVRNRENDIEGVVRSIDRSMKLTASSFKPREIVTVDCGSTDEIKYILTHLTRDIEGLKYCTKDEYLDYVRSK